MPNVIVMAATERCQGQEVSATLWRTFAILETRANLEHQVQEPAISTRAICLGGQVQDGG